MDIYKILTRGTKKAKPSQGKSVLNKTTGQNVKESIPSAGQNATVQLFGQQNSKQSQESESSLGKRKRDGFDAHNIPLEIDFFHSGNEPRKSSDLSKDHKANGGPVVAEAVIQEEPERLSLEECKRKLREHRVKILVLRKLGSDIDKITTANGNSSSKKEKKSKSKSHKDEQDEHQKPHKPIPVYTQPFSTFLQLVSRYGLRKRLHQNIESLGFQEPTEIQMASLPILVGSDIIDGNEDLRQQDGIDLLAVAPTGSGKTLAFLIPAIHQLLSRKTKLKNDGPRVLILAPTRELASQIVGECRRLVQGTGLRVSLIKKGMRAGDEMEIENEGSNDSDGEADYPQEEQNIPTTVKSDIIVSTPMALIHALERNEAEQSDLPLVENLVLDEADVLLDPMFKDQTIQIWRACSNPQLRCSLWSATMSSTIEELALSFLGAKTVIRLVVGLKDSALPNVQHLLTYSATEPGKLLALRQLLHPTAPSSSTSPSEVPAVRPPFLVFTQTIPRAVALHAELRYDIPAVAGGSTRIAVLHSGMSETARAKVMAGVRRGEIWVVITTDLLARGVDFRGLNGVVNYDVPTSAAAYVHRAGRTGRAGRKGGVVVTLFTKDDFAVLRPIVNVITTSEKLAGGESKSSVPQWLLDSLPEMNREERQRVKKRGIEVRRPGIKGARISTKAPGDRRKQFKQGTKVFSKASKADEDEAEFDGFGE